MQTLVIDLEDTLVKRINHRCSDLETSSIILVNQPEKQCGSKNCKCNILAYKISPLFQEFISSTSQYYEIVAYSSFPNYVLKILTARLDIVAKRRSFAASLNESHFFKTQDEAFENFHLFLANRKQAHIVYVGANTLRLLAAASQSIAVVPMAKI